MFARREWFTISEEFMLSCVSPVSAKTMRNIMTTEIKECVHIFICNNQKVEGRCCANKNSLEIFEYFKSALASKISKLNPSFKYKVVKTSCLGRCSLGPNIFISPDNTWYTYTTTEDIDTIINEHLIHGKRVVRLLHKAHD